MRLRPVFLSLSPVIAFALAASAHAATFPPVDPARDHILGNPAPLVQIVEYIDLEDPFSKQHHATMKALAERYGNKVNWVIRHLPLAFHQNAQKEAEAAECVAELGDTRKFWIFIDEIFKATASGGNGFSLTKLAPLAADLGLDKAKFQACLDSGKYAPTVLGSADAAMAAGIYGTPTTFLVRGSDGKWQKIDGAQPYTDFSELVTSMLYGTWTPPPQVLDAPTPVPVPETPAPPAGSLPAVDPKTDHIRGNPDARITVIEYTDFECPFCITHFKTMSQLLRKYRGKVNWVYRPYPLSFHAGAQQKAETAECVAQLKGNNAFWRFHDQIFKRSSPDMEGAVLPVEKLGALARNLRVDQKKLGTCLKDGKVTKQVAAIMDAGTAAGVNGTPASFVVDNRTGKWEMISGAVPLKGFTDVIDPMLKGKWKAPEPVPAGDPLDVYYPPVPLHVKPAPDVDRSWDHIRGEPNARISLVFYADADDPFTRKLYPDLLSLLKEYPTTLNLVYRHYPLTFHPNADLAAVAMECAAEMKGHQAFWAFADILFGAQRTDYNTVAAEVNLNQSDFATCVYRDTRRAHIKQDIEGADKAGIPGTPTSFLIEPLTGKQVQINGAVPLADFRKAIDALLKGDAP